MRILLTIVFLLICGVSTSQVLKDEDGEIIPFGMQKKYHQLLYNNDDNLINVGNYNNDSLFRSYNGGKNRSDDGEVLSAGMVVIEDINFFEKASKIRVEEGTVFFLRFNSKSAKSMYFYFKKYSLNIGSYLAIYSINNHTSNYDKIICTAGNEDTQFGIFSNYVAVELFVPSNNNINENLIIKELHYGFAP